MNVVQIKQVERVKAYSEISKELDAESRRCAALAKECAKKGCYLVASVWQAKAEVLESTSIRLKNRSNDCAGKFRRE